MLTSTVHCGMFIPLGDDKHRFVRYNSNESALEIRDKIQSETISENFFSENNFSSKNPPPQKRKKIGWKKILVFCLGLHTTVVFRMHQKRTDQT